MIKSLMYDINKKFHEDHAILRYIIHGGFLMCIAFKIVSML